MTQILHDIVEAMLEESPSRLFAALQDMKVYAEKFQNELWIDTSPRARLRAERQNRGRQSSICGSNEGGRRG